MLSQQLRDLNLSDDFYVGSDLSNEANFLEKAKEKIEEQVSNCRFFIGKRIMCLSVELSVTPTKAIAKILLNTIEEIFAKQEILYKIGWCSTYTMGKRYDRTYLIEFAWLNISPNQKIYVKEGEKQEIAPFSLCSCFSCNQMLKYLS